MVSPWYPHGFSLVSTSFLPGIHMGTIINYHCNGYNSKGVRVTNMILHNILYCMREKGDSNQESWISHGTGQ